jgi:hypothetical protein
MARGKPQALRKALPVKVAKVAKQQKVEVKSEEEEEEDEEEAGEGDDSEEVEAKEQAAEEVEQDDDGEGDEEEQAEGDAEEEQEEAVDEEEEEAEGDADEEEGERDDEGDQEETAYDGQDERFKLPEAPAVDVVAGEDAKKKKGKAPIKPMSKEALEKFTEAVQNTGVVYLSRIPPFMKVCAHALDSQSLKRTWDIDKPPMSSQGA